LGVKLTTEIKGYEDFAFGENRWDLILLSYIGGREMKELVARALWPGGIVVLEAFHRDASKTAPIGGDVVFDAVEVPAVSRTAGCALRGADRHQHFGQGPLRLVRYCGEKPAE
jgi:hypothetical protein